MPLADMYYSQDLELDAAALLRHFETFIEAPQLKYKSIDE